MILFFCAGYPQEDPGEVDTPPPAPYPRPMKLKKAGPFAFFCLILTLATGENAFGEKPYWWDNPHRDDEVDMYEKGSSTDAPTETQAQIQAVRAAKALLMERIGIAPALEAAGLTVSPEYALVNDEVADAQTEKSGPGWKAWVLVRYPQKEKKKLLDRWETSLKSLSDLQIREGKIPLQFKVELSTAEGKNQYRDGEFIVFRFRSAQDCSLVLWDHQSDGTSVLLFPNKYHPDSWIKAGQTITIPNPDDADFKLLVGAPYGDDRVEAIACTSKTALQNRFGGMVKNLREGAVAVMGRGIYVEGLDQARADGAQESAKTLWSHAELTLSSFPAR